jgi:hypothetical protein
LINEKGIDLSRIDTRVGTDSGRNVTNVFVPDGATYDDNDTKPADTLIDQHGAAKDNRNP